jgi:anti-sigma regulatory factor (Ser/Thr protein kinase)
VGTIDVTAAQIRTPHGGIRRSPERWRVMSRFHVSIDAEPTEIGIVRLAATSFLRAMGWPEADIDPVVFATSEAVSNSVEHAYRGFTVGRIGIDLQIDVIDAGRERLCVTVSDDGRWRPETPAVVGHNGLLLIRGLVDRLLIHTDGRGTRTILQLDRAR